MLTPAWVEGNQPTPCRRSNVQWTPVHLASHYEIEFIEDTNFSPGDSSYVTCFTNRTT